MSIYIYLSLHPQIELRKTENTLREIEEEYIRTKRSLEDTKTIAEEAQSTLRETQSTLEKTQLDFKQRVETLQQQLEVAQNEAKQESKEKEKLVQLRRQLELRTEELEWYFLPVEEQEKLAAAGSFYTPALQLLKQKKKELMTELDDIRGKHIKIPNKIEDLHSRLVEGLKSIPETNKEVLAYQLQGLMQALEAAEFPIRVRMKISVTMVEGLVDPEIVREMRIITEIMVEDSLHFMDTPETMVVLAMRDVDEEKARPESQGKKRSELLSFRDALLNRLAKSRAKRMHKPKEEVKDGILQEIYSKIDG